MHPCLSPSSRSPLSGSRARLLRLRIPCRGATGAPGGMTAGRSHYSAHACRHARLCLLTLLRFFAIRQCECQSPARRWTSVVGGVRAGSLLCMSLDASWRLTGAVPRGQSLTPSPRPAGCIVPPRRQCPSSSGGARSGSWRLMLFAGLWGDDLCMSIPLSCYPACLALASYIQLMCYIDRLE